MNFAPALKKSNTPAIIAEVENALNTTDNIRSRLVGVLNKPMRTHNNLSPLQVKALKELYSDQDIVILPADKGRVTVVMDTKEYDDKILHLLSDQDTYKNLKIDPTPTLQTKMNAILLTLKKQDKLPPKLYNLFRCSNGITPQLYGLPKFHKPDVPLRPIVSFYSSPTYQLSKHLCRLLSSLVGNSSSHFSNSSNFITFINQQQLGDEILVSFDVVSLFTKVPTDVAIKITRERLQGDHTLEDKTALTIDDITRLLEFCLQATYFSFRGKYQQQIFGTAIGSPVSVTVADIVMENCTTVDSIYNEL